MLCKKCVHCGLCEGDGSFKANKTLLVSTEFSAKSKLTFCGSEKFSPSDIGIAVDVGTTTIAAKAFNLQNGKELFSCGEQNLQVKFGSDVISRINFSLQKNASAELYKCLKNQIEKIISYLMKNISSFYLSARISYSFKMPKLKKIVIAGNTCMESFAAGFKVESLAQFPFKIPSDFGFERKAQDFFEGEYILPETKIFFAPVISAFVGGDTLCAILSSFNFDLPNLQFLLDVGTNCEMAVFDKKSASLVCTSSSAGPAFEGQGIEKGSSAVDGAISKVFYDKENQKFICSTVGEKYASSICGTGLISAINVFLENNLISSEGTILNGQNKIFLTEKIYLSQNDIRNFQLAKSAVKTGLNFLSKNFAQSDLENSILYLAGGFGTQIDELDAINTKMFPDFFRGKIVHCGNAALSGASLLFDEKYYLQAQKIIENSKSINLATENDFQNKFIENLGL